MRSEQRPSVDRRTEGTVDEWLRGGPDQLPDHVMQDVMRYTATTPQIRRRFLGRWLDRDRGTGRRAVEREHLLQPNRRTRLMLTVTGLTAAIAVIALVGNVIQPDRGPTDADGSTYTVAADGSGAFVAIGAAVDAAADGDTVLVQPGIYTEAIVIDKDIMLVGDGPREEIMISAPVDGPEWETGWSKVTGGSYAVAMVGSNGGLSGVTLRGEPSRLFVEGGSPVIEDVLLDQVGLAYEGSAVLGSVIITDNASPVLRDNLFLDGGDIDVFDDSDPVIRANVIEGAGAIVGDFGLQAIIDGNVLRGPGTQGISWFGDTTATITNNTIEGRTFGMITAMHAEIFERDDPLTWFRPTIAGNSIIGAHTGISLPAVGGPMVQNNTITGGTIGIDVSGGTATLRDNEMSDQSVGISVTGGGEHLLDGNRITDNVVGLSAAYQAQIKLTDNVFCDNETNFAYLLHDGLDIAGNDLCADSTAR